MEPVAANDDIFDTAAPCDAGDIDTIIAAPSSEAIQKPAATATSADDGAAPEPEVITRTFVVGPTGVVSHPLAFGETEAPAIEERQLIPAPQKPQQRTWFGWFRSWFGWVFWVFRCGQRKRSAQQETKEVLVAAPVRNEDDYIMVGVELEGEEISEVALYAKGRPMWCKTVRPAASMVPLTKPMNMDWPLNTNPRLEVTAKKGSNLRLTHHITPIPENKREMFANFMRF